jgi:Sigma-70 region 2
MGKLGLRTCVQKMQDGKDAMTTLPRKAFRIDSASRRGGTKTPGSSKWASPLDEDSSDQHFAAVVMLHLDDAYALAHWLAGNSADAEDIVQEACLRAL